MRSKLTDSFGLSVGEWYKTVHDLTLGCSSAMPCETNHDSNGNNWPDGGNDRNVGDRAVRAGIHDQSTNQEDGEHCTSSVEDRVNNVKLGDIGHVGAVASDDGMPTTDMHGYRDKEPLQNRFGGAIIDCRHTKQVKPKSGEAEHVNGSTDCSGSKVVTKWVEVSNVVDHMVDLRVKTDVVAKVVKVGDVDELS